MMLWLLIKLYKPTGLLKNSYFLLLSPVFYKNLHPEHPELLLREGLVQGSGNA